MRIADISAQLKRCVNNGTMNVREDAICGRRDSSCFLIYEYSSDVKCEHFNEQPANKIYVVIAFDID